jgi:hypothetical protein
VNSNTFPGLGPAAGRLPTSLTESPPRRDEAPPAYAQVVVSVNSKRLAALYGIQNPEAITDDITWDMVERTGKLELKNYQERTLRNNWADLENDRGYTNEKWYAAPVLTLRNPPRKHIPLVCMDLLPSKPKILAHSPSYFKDHLTMKKTRYDGYEIVCLLDDGEVRGARMVSAENYFSVNIKRSGPETYLETTNSVEAATHRFDHSYLLEEFRQILESRGTRPSSQPKKPLIFVQVTINGQWNYLFT